MHNYEAGQINENGKLICGGKTRSGKPCQSSPVVNGSGRCRMHNGHSLRGIAHPKFKTGKYSAYMSAHLVENYEAGRNDNDLLALRDEIAVVDARIMELMDQVKEFDFVSNSKQITDAYRGVMNAIAARDRTKQAKHLADMGKLINGNANAVNTWDGIFEAFDLRRKLVESERKRLVEIQQFMDRTEALQLAQRLLLAVHASVRDVKTLQAIQFEFDRISGYSDLA